MIFVFETTKHFVHYTISLTVRSPPESGDFISHFVLANTRRRPSTYTYWVFIFQTEGTDSVVIGSRQSPDEIPHIAPHCLSYPSAFFTATKISLQTTEIATSFLHIF